MENPNVVSAVSNETPVSVESQDSQTSVQIFDLKQYFYKTPSFSLKGVFDPSVLVGYDAMNIGEKETVPVKNGKIKETVTRTNPVQKEIVSEQLDFFIKFYNYCKTDCEAREKKFTFSIAENTVKAKIAKLEAAEEPSAELIQKWTNLLTFLKETNEERLRVKDIVASDKCNYFGALTEDQFTQLLEFERQPRVKGVEQYTDAQEEKMWRIFRENHVTGGKKGPRTGATKAEKLAYKENRKKASQEVSLEAFDL
jgi:hypothetical protein